MKLIPHESAEKFFYTPYNNPWIKIPVCYIEGNYLFTLEEYKQSYINSDVVNVTYIKEPSKFANI
jgi:phosphoribosylformylglycinamidine (FGAM) synthase-like amidotransferase family enzyme